MKRLSFLFIGLAFLVSCGPKSYFDSYQNIKNSEWHKDSVLTFTPNIAVSTKAVDLKINIRHSGLYAYSNLFLFVNITLPNGVSNTDTIECTLANKRGKWYGSGLGDIFDFQQPIGRVLAPEKGDYKFTIIQGMRTTVLNNIMDVGLSITEVKD